MATHVRDNLNHAWLTFAVLSVGLSSMSACDSTLVTPSTAANQHAELSDRDIQELVLVDEDDSERSISVSQPASETPNLWEFGLLGVTDDELAALSFEWSFGDGATGTGAVASHVFWDPGTYSVTVVARDSNGFVEFRLAGPVQVKGSILGSDTSEFRVVFESEVNRTSDGRRFQAIARAFGLLPDEQVSYTWAFADGAVKNGVQTEHQLANLNPYAVTLTARTDAGRTASFTSQYTLSNSGTATLPTGNELAFPEPTTAPVESAVNNVFSVDAGEARSVLWGDAVDLVGEVTGEFNEGTLTFEWRQVGGVPAVIEDPAARITGFTTPSRLSPASELRFSLTVSDGENSSSDEVTFFARSERIWHFAFFMDDIDVFERMLDLPEFSTVTAIWLNGAHSEILPILDEDLSGSLLTRKNQVISIVSRFHARGLKVIWVRGPWDLYGEIPRGYTRDTLFDHDLWRDFLESLEAEKAYLGVEATGVDLEPYGDARDVLYQYMQTNVTDGEAAHFDTFLQKVGDTIPQPDFATPVTPSGIVYGYLAHVAHHESTPALYDQLNIIRNHADYGASYLMVYTRPFKHNDSYPAAPFFTQEELIGPRLEEIDARYRGIIHYGHPEEWVD